MLDAVGNFIDVPTQIDLVKIDHGVERETKRADDIPQAQEADFRSRRIAFDSILRDLVGKVHCQRRPAAEANDVNVLGLQFSQSASYIS